MSFAESMRARLLSIQGELQELAAFGKESAAVVELDQTKMGRLSRMDAMQAQAMAQASSQRRDALGHKVDAALKRIDADEFGICLSCDEPINPKRLEFDPTVTLCIDCASEAERQ